MADHDPTQSNLVSYRYRCLPAQSHSMVAQTTLLLFPFCEAIARDGQ